MRPTEDAAAYVDDAPALGRAAGVPSAVHHGAGFQAAPALVTPAGASPLLASLHAAVERELARLRIDPIVAAIAIGGAAIIVSFQSFGSVAFFEQHFEARVGAASFAGMYAYLYWFASSLAWLFLLPVLVLVLLPGQRLGDYGLGLGDWRFGLRAVLLLYAAMLPVVALASFRPNFIDYYPMSGYVRDQIGGRPDGAGHALGAFAIYECAYAAYFIGWEFFHRGFLTIGLSRVIGWYAVLVVAVPFAILHVAKPMPEAYGAIAASLVLGWLAIRTRSSWYGFGLHASIAVTMDVLAALHQL